MTDLSLAEELRSIVSEQATEDLQVIIEALGEACEVRLPIYETRTGVFANEIQDEDPISYGDPEMRKILLIPLADRLHAGDETSGGFSLNPEPLRGLLLGEAPPERTMITTRRNKPTHYYVLQRQLLTDSEPLVMQLFMAPVTIPTEIIGEGPYLPTAEEKAEIAEAENLANMIAPPTA